MPINFTKPVTTDNYATGVLPTIRDAFSALAQLLDPAVAGTLTGTPTGAFRLSSATGALERYNGSTWSRQAINGVYFEASGNVGIGTTTPSSIFAVRGSGAMISVQTTANAIFTGMRTIAADGSTETASVKSHADSGELRFTAGFSGWGGYQDFYTNGSFRMRLDTAGNLGIGTAPSVRLHVDGGGTAEVLRVNSTASTYISMYRSGVRRSYLQSDAGGLLMVQEENLPFALYTNGTFRSQWDGAGNFHNLGIGRFGGWYNTAGSVLGLAVEVGVSSSEGWAISYNRSGATYSTLNIQGSAVKIWNGTTAIAEVTSTGLLNYGGIEVGWRSIPRASYNSAPGAAYRGQCMAATGAVTLNASTFAAGDAFSIYNDSGSAITITQGSGLTLRLAGTTTSGSRTIAPRGMATVWFNSGSEALMSGPGVS